MSDSWNQGYVTDIGYTFGYYEEMNPIRVNYLLNYCGLKSAQFNNGFELGIGQGISINVHSLTTGMKWYGNDFNPDQAQFARELAQITGAEISDNSFEDVAGDMALPQFDYICLHGIWSWISDANRKAIVDFCHSKLNVGGVLYISYNTRPGHTPMVPIRQLLMQHAQETSPAGIPVNSKIRNSFEFVDELMALEPKYFEVNKHVVDKLKEMRDKPRNYLAHEYFNRDWQPMDITEMAGYFEKCKLRYVTSADYIHQVKSVNYSAEQLEFLKKFPNQLFSEMLGDYITNSQFRKDIWIKGGTRVSDFEKFEILKQQRFCLASTLEELDYSITGLHAKANLQEDVYKPIVELFKEKHYLTNGEVFDHINSNGEITLDAVCEATMVLCAKKILAPAHDLSTARKNFDKCKEFNLEISEFSKYKNGQSTLVSPLTGGGVILNKFSQIFVNYVLTSKSKNITADTLATYVQDILTISGQKVRQKGKTISDLEESMDYLRKSAEKFVSVEMPFLKSLMII